MKTVDEFHFLEKIYDGSVTAILATMTSLAQSTLRRIDTLQPYDRAATASLITSTNTLANETFDLIAAANKTSQNKFSTTTTEGIKSAFLMHHLTIQSNKRSLLIYHRDRVRRLIALFASGRDSENLCAADMEFLNGYKKLRRGLPQPSNPPKHVLVFVKGLYFADLQ